MMTATLSSRAGRRFVRFLATLLIPLALAWVGAMPRGAAAADLLDGNEDFKLLSQLGFEQAVDGAHPQGTRTNDYMWSMSWFKGKLYVGTGRFEIDPATNVPRGGQIWRYTPGGADGRSGSWALAFEAPNFLGTAREFGYRWMTVCNFYGTEYLFVSTLGVLQGNILYTTDGVNFNPMSRTGMPAGTVGFRTMACFNEAGVRPMLITTPVGKGGDAQTFDSDRSDNPIVLSNSNPGANTAWRDYSAMGMGDPDNGVIFSLINSGPYIYAGVSNEVTGGQLWRTSGCSASQPFCVPRWTKVLDRGGGRPKTSAGLVKNTGFADIAEHNGYLYLAMSAPALDGNLIRAELLRLRTSDNTFEVLIGEPRMDGAFDQTGRPASPTLPSNLRCALPREDLNGIGGADDCPPTTRRGAGLGVPGSAATGYPNGPQFYFWRVFNYAYHPTKAPKGDNRLYLGTFQGALDAGGLPGLGFDVLASADGTQWSSVTKTGFGFLQQQGMRSIASTPYGLAIGGTHFPFTPEITAQFPVPEIRGGNVWMGVPTAITETAPPVTTIASPPSPDEGATLATRTATFSWSATDAPPPGSLPLTYAYRLDPLEPSFSAFGSASTKTYTNLPNGSYTFYVIARDAGGNTEAAGAPGAGNRRTFSVNAVDAAPSVTITAAPASTSASSAATFVWAGSDDLTPPASLTYNRWLSPLESDPGTFAGGTSKVYNGLADGAYTFHVIAKDGAGNTSAEATRSFTVAVPPGPPASPGPATIALVSTRTFRIGWTGVAGATRYEVEGCKIIPSCTWAAVASNVAADVTSYDAVVSAASLYAYRVRACNANGCSTWAGTRALGTP